MIQAAIFDLDGTVIETEDDWEEAFLQVARKHGIAQPKLLQANSWWHEPGLGLSANWRRIIADRARAEELARETSTIYQKSKTGDFDLKLRPGTAELIDKMRARGWKLALSTGSNWNVVEAELLKLNLYAAFDVTTTGEEVLVLKPDPEIYLLTAQKLEVEAEQCLVIEDAVAGVRAAKEAGMLAVALVSDYAPAKMSSAAGADFVVADFSIILGLIDKIE